MAKITKIADKLFNNQHPNNINVGYCKEVVKDYIPNTPVIGERYIFGNLRTSTVVDFKETENNILIETSNSTYLVTKESEL